MSKTIATPQFTHDCTYCTFIGHREGYDIYICPQAGVGIPTVIARYGNEGWDYNSGAGAITSGDYFQASPLMAESLRQAVFALVPESRVYRSHEHNAAVEAVNKLQEPYWVNIAAAILAEYALAQFAKPKEAPEKAARATLPSGYTVIESGEDHVIVGVDFQHMGRVAPEILHYEGVDYLRGPIEVLPQRLSGQFCSARRYTRAKTRVSAESPTPTRQEGTPDLDTPWKVDPNSELPVGIIRDDEDGEGLLTIDFGQEGMLHREEAVRLAEHIVALHNRALALREFQHHA